MSMGGHAAPPVARSPSVPSLSKFLLALVALIFAHATVTSGEVDYAMESLLKFKSAMTNTQALDSWHTSSDPCIDHWNGVICSEGQVWGLQLDNMQLSGQIDVDSLANFPSLRSLNFNNNGFLGPMPKWKKLGGLASLSISNNHFSDEIRADTFDGMDALDTFNMAHNDFRGPIPSSLSKLKLSELRMDNNKFTGAIPQLQDGLIAFNVSNNQLEGPIPAKLRQFDPRVFSGNKLLCGAPAAAPCDGEPKEDVPVIPKTNSSPSVPPPIDPVPTNKMTKWKLAWIVIAALVGLALIIVLILAFIRHRKKRKFDGFIAPISMKQNNQPPPKSSHEVEAPPAVFVNGRIAKKPETGKLSFVRKDREIFDLQDLLRASAEVLGSGNFGSSYKAVLMDGQAVVVKRYKKMTNVNREEFHDHMGVLGGLKHPNLLPLVAYYYRREEKLLVFDHVHNGSLAGVLHGKHSEEQPRLDWPKRLKIVKGVAKGLVYLQSKLPCVTVAHGHLKSTNVLLDENFNALLMDYTLAPVVNLEQVHDVLVSYKSPEYTKTGRVTKKTDVWCLGILILEILTGMIPENYVIGQGIGYDPVLAGWVRAIVSGDSKEVFDPEMGNIENCRGEMRRLLTIGAACCEEELEKRWDLKLALEKIEDVKEM